MTSWHCNGALQRVGAGQEGFLLPSGTGAVELGVYPQMQTPGGGWMSCMTG